MMLTRRRLVFIVAAACLASALGFYFGVVRQVATPGNSQSLEPVASPADTGGGSRTQTELAQRVAANRTGEMSQVVDSLVLDLLYGTSEQSHRALQLLSKRVALDTSCAEILCHTILEELLRDARWHEPDLRNTRPTELVLLATGPSRICASALLRTYCSEPAGGEAHVALREKLAIWLHGCESDPWKVLLANWQGMKPRDLERALRELFLSTPELARASCCALLRTSLIELRDSRKAGVILDVVIDHCSPGTAGLELLLVFGDAHAVVGGGAVDGVLLATARRLASSMARSDSSGIGKGWLTETLRIAGGMSSDPGVDMATALVAAECGEEAVACNTLYNLFERASGVSMRNVMLTNLGRVTNGGLLLSMAAHNGISLGSAPVSMDDITAQATLAMSLYNSLALPSTERHVVSAEYERLIPLWLHDPRCHPYLVHLLSELQHYHCSNLQSLLQRIERGNVASLKKAASATLSAWRSK